MFVLSSIRDQNECKATKFHHFPQKQMRQLSGYRTGENRKLAIYPTEQGIQTFPLLTRTINGIILIFLLKLSDRLQCGFRLTTRSGIFELEQKN